MAIVQSSDPLVAAVVPHGGVTPIITPNPIAAGIADVGRPDAASTSRRRSRAWASRTRNMPPAARCPDRGSSTARATRPTIPRVLSTSRRARCCRWAASTPATRASGSALLVEALTAGLAGFGRADPSEGWGGTVFVQVLDPEAFGGLDAFRRQMDHLVRARARVEAARRCAIACACRAKRGLRATARAARERRRALSVRSCRRLRRGRRSSASTYLRRFAKPGVALS